PPSSMYCVFFFSSRRRHTSSPRDWSSDVCSSDLNGTSSPRLLSAASSVARPSSLQIVGRRSLISTESCTLETLPPGECSASRLEIGRASCREGGEMEGLGGGVGARERKDGGWSVY